MHDFIHVSDAKIEMIANQINQPKQKQSSLILKGGIGKWFGIERRVERSNAPPET